MYIALHYTQCNMLSIIRANIPDKIVDCIQQEEDVFLTFKRQQLVMKTEAGLWLSPFLCAVVLKRRMANDARAVAVAVFPP